MKLERHRQYLVRVLQIIGIWTLGALYALFALLFIFRPASPNDPENAVLCASYALACTVIALRAGRIRNTDPVVWSRGMEANREATAGGVLMLLASIASLPDWIGQAFFADALEALAAFIGIGVWLLLVGAGRIQQIEAENKEPYYRYRAFIKNPSAPPSSAIRIWSPIALMFGLVLFTAIDGFLVWLFLADPTIELRYSSVRMTPSPASAAAAGTLLVFSVLIAFQTCFVRAAPPDRFLRAGSLVRQFLCLNGIFAGAVFMSFYIPAYSSAFLPLLALGTALLLGALAYGYIGPFRTEYAALRSELSRA